MGCVDWAVPFTGHCKLKNKKLNKGIRVNTLKEYILKTLILKNEIEFNHGKIINYKIFH